MFFQNLQEELIRENNDNYVQSQMLEHKIKTLQRLWNVSWQDLIYRQDVDAKDGGFFSQLSPFGLIVPFISILMGKL